MVSRAASRARTTQRISREETISRFLRCVCVTTNTRSNTVLPSITLQKYGLDCYDAFIARVLLLVLPVQRHMKRGTVLAY